MKTTNLASDNPEQGGALVETALLLVVMVPIVLYAVFFFDMSLVNIKTLEAARYAAWEMTALEISDYATHKHDLDGKVHSLKDPATNLTLLEEVKYRWADDMNGATSPHEKLAQNAKNGIYQESASGLSLLELDLTNLADGMPVLTADGLFLEEENNIPLQTEGALPLDSSGSESVVDGFLGKLVGLMSERINSVYDTFGFNKNGFPYVAFAIGVRPRRFSPIFTKSGELAPGVPLPMLSTVEKLAVDAWDLKYGGDVDLGPDKPDKNAPVYSYYSQVERMMFAGLFSSNGGLGQVFNNLGNSSVIKKATDYIAKNVRLPWRPVVRSYAMKSYNGHADGCGSGQRNIKACVQFSNAASYSDAGTPPMVFHTNAYKDAQGESGHNPYLEVYERQSPRGQSATDAKTGYYLGCGKAQMLDRSKCWTD